MNKSVKLLLVISIAVNAVWVLGAASGWVLFGKAAGGGRASANVAQGGGGDGVGALSAGARKEMAAVLSTSDAVALRDRLRSLDLPDDVVREMVTARIKSNYAALRGKIEGTAACAEAKQPWWRQKDSWSCDGNSNCTAEQRNELKRLELEEKKQIKEVLGRDGEVPSQARIIHSYLSADRAEQLSDLDSDYYGKRRKLEGDMSGFRMPGDKAALDLLVAEHKRAIDAFLTPEEKVAHELHDSETAWRLRWAFADFDGTEAEYNTIFAMRKGVYEKYFANSASANNWTEYSLPASEREAAQKEVNALIKETLGEERYADYLRAQRWDYRKLKDAARRFNLSADTVARAYQARENAANEAARISGDASLSAGEKSAAFAALSEQTMGKIRAALGNDVGNAYIDNELPWLKKLPGGGKVETDLEGDVKVTPAKK